MKEIKNVIDKAVNNIRTSAIATITSVLKKNKTVSVETIDEEIRDINIISPYGFFSLPLPGQDGQILINNSSKIVSFIGVDPDYTPIDVEPGEVVIYNKSNTYIHLKNDTVMIDGNVKIKGNIVYDGTLTQGDLREEFPHT